LQMKSLILTDYMSTDSEDDKGILVRWQKLWRSPMVGGNKGVSGHPIG
jgi:hypothetical protein